ncbi:MAG: murein L,D-transpeptidase catalytic domain family protein [Cytophagaceae bacterium]|nr:murein L,D-transpeptidase catalytic domain family protein [Cytophagaceae bacterium]
MKAIMYILSVVFLPLSSCVKGATSVDETDVPSVQKIQEAKRFVREQSMDTSLFILIDMRIHSGKNRFFIWDAKGDSILYSGLVCHGSGKGSTAAIPVFSNEKGSYCSSLGRYAIGARSYSQWGIHIHYKLHGLDTSNSNAMERIVVLHSYDEVPDIEIYPYYLPLGYSLGCPVVSNSMMTRIDALLKNRKQRVLLWMY